MNENKKSNGTELDKSVAEPARLNLRREVLKSLRARTGLRTGPGCKNGVSGCAHTKQTGG
jgi:hypothetical protein